MFPKFSEMVATRTDLALSLEAGFDKSTEEVARGYGDFLAPVLEEGELAFDARFQLVLLRRSVEHQRLRLRGFNESVVAHVQDDGKVRSEIGLRRDAFTGKLRLVRHACRGNFGAESLRRIGFRGEPPRPPARLYEHGLVIKASLENPGLGLVPLLDRDCGSGRGRGTSAWLAAQLDPELSDLGELVGDRHRAQRQITGAQLDRQKAIEVFDRSIRGIVRLAQGMFRLAGRDDLERRFRPVFQRVIRKLKDDEPQEDAAPAPEAAASEATSD